MEQAGVNSFMKKFKNFLYNNKIKLIAGVILLFVLIFFVVECATVKKADIRVYFAGDAYLSEEQKGNLASALKAVISDEHAKEVQIVSLNIRHAPKENADGAGVDYEGAYENEKMFKQQMIAPDTVICLLSPASFSIAKEDGTISSFEEVGLSVKESADGYGVPLESLPLYESNSAFSILPKGTVLCIKKKGVFRSEKEYLQNVAAFSDLLRFQLQN